MRRASVACFLSVLLAAGCGAPQSKDDADFKVGSTDSPISGRTLSCRTDGSASKLTFAADGKLSGRLLDTSVTGTWHVNAKREIHTHVVAGSVSLRDDLRRSGSGWNGRTLRCSG